MRRASAHHVRAVFTAAINQACRLGYPAHAIAGGAHVSFSLDTSPASAGFFIPLNVAIANIYSIYPYANRILFQAARR